MRSRLTRFEDNVQTYSSWKATFKSFTKDLCFTPAVELDLLVSWLGPSSSATAKSIKAATTSDPGTGLKTLWIRLDEEYGAPEMIEASLRRRVNDFPRVTNNMKELYKLSDILREVAALKSDPKYQSLFSYFDTSVGVKPIVEKLNHSLQTKWVNKARKYKVKNNVTFPPFSVFCDFVREQALILNDPSLNSNISDQHRSKGYASGQSKDGKSITVRKTEFQQTSGEMAVKSESTHCPFHVNANHSLNECRFFKKKTLSFRKQFLRDNKICFKCCETDKHMYRNCKIAVKCSDCGSLKHPTALHTNGTAVGLLAADNSGKGNSPLAGITDHGGEAEKNGGENSLSNKCTSVCGDGFAGRSCAKAVLVKVHHKDQPELSLSLYALLDDQSNCTLAKPEFFDFMGVSNSSVQRYTLTSCSGQLKTTGRRASGFIVCAIDGSCNMTLPLVTECNEIPSDRREIPTPDVIRHYKHLEDLPIPPIDSF